MAKILLAEFVERSEQDTVSSRPLSYASPLTKKLITNLERTRNGHDVTHVEIYTPEEAEKALTLFRKDKFDAAIIANHGKLYAAKIMGKDVADVDKFIEEFGGTPSVRKEVGAAKILVNKAAMTPREKEATKRFIERVGRSSNNTPVIIYDESHQQIRPNGLVNMTIVDETMLDEFAVCAALRHQLESHTRSA